MQRNNQQTYMTPAKDKNAQYFAWDFVGRTIVGSHDSFSFLPFLSMPSIAVASALFPLQEGAAVAGGTARISSPYEEPTACLISKGKMLEIYVINRPLTTTLQSYAVNTDPTLQHVTPQWKDAIGRSILISDLILDKKPGFLSQLVEQTYPGHNPGGQPAMSAEIISAAEEVQSAANDA
jgi:hypothetical protein